MLKNLNSRKKISYNSFVISVVSVFIAYKLFFFLDVEFHLYMEINNFEISIFAVYINLNQ